MAQQTALSVMAIPGRVQNFVAKTEVEVVLAPSDASPVIRRAPTTPLTSLRRSPSIAATLLRRAPTTSNGVIRRT